MPPDLTPDSIREASFDGSLRGYDRSQVDEFRRDVADHVAALESRIASLDVKVDQLGLSEATELREELEKVGTDIAAILAQAERTATELRQRAGADAARWRADAEAEIGAARADARATVEEMRAQAWAASTEMLEQGRVEAQQLVDEAAEGALFTRAEAEREVQRLIGEARREADEILRGAQAEATRMGIEARAESERVLETARRSAESAQERTRALEVRRAELMGELEAARHGLLELGDEAQGVSQESPERAVGEGTDEIDVWEGDDGTVKLIPSGSGFVPGPVDADEMMAEVERLRSGVLEPEPIREPGPEVEAGPPPAHEPEPIPEPDPDVEAEPVAEVVQEREPPSEPDPEPDPEPELESEPEREPAIEPEPEPEAAKEAGPEPEEANKTEPEPEEAKEGEPEPAADAIEGLFASLRTPEEPDPAPAAEAAPPLQPVAGATPVGDDPQPRPVAGLPAVDAATAFELRDQVLLPIQNRELREVKRRIVDIQNGVLEELRVSTEPWQPDAAGFSAELQGSLSALVHDAYSAGHQAAAQMVDAASPTVSGQARAAKPAVFIDAMVAEVAAAHARAGSDAGVRQRSAAVSRVFRSWRTDQADRRLRFLAYGAYHEGLLAAFNQLEIHNVHAVTEGRMCAECPAANGSAWDPAAGPPSGVSVPPVHAECLTTIVPGGPVGGLAAG